MSEDPRRVWGDAWTLGFTLVGLVLVFTGLGFVLDRWAGTTPWLMTGGVFVGAGLGLAHLASILFSPRGESREGRSEKADDPKDRSRE